MISSWNIRGLNGPLKQSGIKSIITKYKIAVLEVLETMVRGKQGCCLEKKIGIESIEDEAQLF